jgi:hypothetical protein
MLGFAQGIGIHARIAAFYLLFNIPVLIVVYGGPFEPGTQHTFTVFVISLCGVILAAPHFLRFAVVRRLFGWMDALTPKEKEILLNFRIVEAGYFKRSPDYMNRVNPFLFRVGMTGAALSLLGVAPSLIDSYFSTLCGAFAFYLLGVVIVIVVSFFLLASLEQK